MAAEGRIYNEFRSDMIIPKVITDKLVEDNVIEQCVIGVDYGGNHSASAFCLVGFDKAFEKVYVLKEYYDSRNKSAEHLIGKFAEKTQEWQEYCKCLRAAYCDSAEQLLVKSFRNAVNTEVRNALKKPVNTRINMLCRLMSAGRFYVSEECPHLIDAIETAVWDENRINADVRLDNGTSNIDSLDAFEYGIERFEKELFRVN